MQVAILFKILTCQPMQGFFSSEFGSVIRTQSQCQIVSFFPKRGPKIPNLLQTAKVKTLSTKIEYAIHKFQKTRSEDRLELTKFCIKY